MSESEKTLDSEENPWTEEDIKRFKEKYGQDGDPDKPDLHFGISVLGFFIFCLIIFASYKQMWDFVLYNIALLVILGLGSKSLN